MAQVKQLAAVNRYQRYCGGESDVQPQQEVVPRAPASSRVHTVELSQVEMPGRGILNPKLSRLCSEANPET